MTKIESSISVDMPTASVTVPLTANISTRIMGHARRIELDRSAALQEMELISGQDDFLLALLASDGITMGALADTLGISASSATKAAIKLEASDLVRREASRIDSRQNYAFLTPKGREIAREIIARYDLLDEALFSKLKGKGTERLLKLLDKLDNLGGAGKQPKKAGAKKKKPSKSGKSKNSK